MFSTSNVKNYWYTFPIGGLQRWHGLYMPIPLRHSPAPCSWGCQIPFGRAAWSGRCRGLRPERFLQGWHFERFWWQWSQRRGLRLDPWHVFVVKQVAWPAYVYHLPVDVWHVWLAIHDTLSMESCLLVLLPNSLKSTRGAVMSSHVSMIPYKITTYFH